MFKLSTRALALIMALFIMAAAIGCSQSAPVNETAAATTAAPTTAVATEAEAAEVAEIADEETPEAAATTAAPAATTTAPATTAADDEETPAREDITIISFWGSPNSTVQSVVGDDPDSRPYAVTYSNMFYEKYGYTIKHQYIFTGADDTIQRQQLMLASGEPWDTMGGIEWAHPGRVSGAAKDGIIVDFLQYPEHIPNILELFKKQPRLEKELKSDDGALYSVGDVNLTKLSSIWFGPFIRKDLLDKAGIGELPETIQEWYDALVTLKGAGLPHMFSYNLIWFAGYSNAFVSAWDGAGYPQTDGGMSMIVNDAGDIEYGCASPGYREWLAEMNKWYNEGILDVDGFTNGDWGLTETNIVTDKTVGGLHFLGTVGNCDTTGKTLNPEFTLAGTQYPVLNKGDTPRMGQWDPMGIYGDYINAKSKYITEILDWIDFAYSDEVQLMANWGHEGITYTIGADGKRAFTDYYLCEGEDNLNEDGYNRSQVRALYMSLGNRITDPDLWYEDNTQTDAQRNAIPMWNNIQRPANEIRFISFSDEEAETAKKRVDLDTYVTQQMIQFIMGVRPIADYDNYVNELKTVYAMDELVALYNTGFARYKNR